MRAIALTQLQSCAYKRAEVFAFLDGFDPRRVDFGRLADFVGANLVEEFCRQFVLKKFVSMIKNA